MNNTQWYNPNNVNEYNFNLTMLGYVKKALEDTEDNLKEYHFSNEQIQDVKRCMTANLEWSIDMMTMEEARRYFNK